MAKQHKAVSRLYLFEYLHHEWARILGLIRILACGMQCNGLRWATDRPLSALSFPKYYSVPPSVSSSLHSAGVPRLLNE